MERVLKYQWEDIYYSAGYDKYNITPIKEEVDNLVSSQNDLDADLFKQEMAVHNMTRPAIKVNHLPIIKDVINDLLKYDEKLNISVYVLRQDFPEAYATSKTSFVSRDNEYIVVLSQHFFNQLDKDESKSVIAHEFAHFFHNHTSVPCKQILDKFSYKENSLKYKKFIYNLKKWRICKEISADLFALQYTEDWKKTATALIKYETAIFKDVDLLIKGFKNQFRLIEKSRNSEGLKEHPLLLLRVMILFEVGQFLKRVGWNNLFKDEIHTEVQKIIDDCVFEIYPEIIQNRFADIFKIIAELGQVVAVSDGYLDDGEIEYLNFICSSGRIDDIIDEKRLRAICEELTTDPPIKSGFNKLKEETFERVIKQIGKPLNGEKLDISAIVRHLLFVSIQDNEITRNELKIIHEFASHDNFGWNKSDLIQQVFNLGQD